MKYWSQVEYLHQTVTNTNIHVRGTHSYYSHAFGGGFEETVVRYLYGDEYSLKTWKPKWPIDQLYIGDYVAIAAEVVILLGGNHNHRTDWFSLYPFPDYLIESHIGKGDTVIHDGAWLGMRSMLMPGVTLGEGAVVAAHAVVTKSVEPYTIVAGNPAKVVKKRFTEASINRLLKLNIYDWDEEKLNTMKTHLCNNDIDTLEQASLDYDVETS